MKRILHVLESFAPGGIETTFLHVLRAFKTADPVVRHEVLAFAGGALEARYREVADAVSIGCDADTIDRHVAAGYDLVHILFERCAYRLVPQLLATASTPVVYGKGYDMGGMYRLNEGLRWQADESMLMACDGATFTTAALAAGYDIPADRTTVLRKAADVARFAALPAPDSKTPNRIVCVANLHARKRLGDLILALAGIAQAVPDVELRLVGGGAPAEIARLTALAAENHLSDRVSFAGITADVAPEIAAARVVALPSSCEGVPTALLEGMAAGRPVVASRVGHVASIVDDGVEGFLVETGDVEALGDRLLRLLMDAGLAGRMGEAARRRAAAHDVRVIAATLLAALNRSVRRQPEHGAA
jgi:glycosyltransferase involved in cell wall biosynthesis